MKHQKLLFLILLFTGILSFAQQNEEFRQVKSFFDNHRVMLDHEFRKRFESTKDKNEKLLIRQDFVEFMTKMDSVQNVALINAIVKVRNREDLSRFFPENQPKSSEVLKNIKDKSAEFPGGVNALRKSLVDLFYFSPLDSEKKSYRAEISFIVDKMGAITDVHASGDDVIFNRQAEIAMYLIPEKFSPAVLEGQLVRARFRVPISMKFD